MTIPDRIMEEARKAYADSPVKVIGSLEAGAIILTIARAIQAAEQRGAASSQQAEPGRRVRHLKRGSEYSVIAHGRLQVDGDLDNEKVTVYRGDDGQVWVRPDYEFNDGRFEDIGPAATSPSPASDSARVIDMAVAWRNASIAVASLSVSDPVYREKFNTLANAEDALNSAIREVG